MRVACDSCEAAAFIGPDPAEPGAVDGWCEACQLGRRLEAGAPEFCVTCNGPLTVGPPRFVELFGEMQQLDAALKAWDNDPEPLAALLPERPRFVTDLTPPVPAPGDPESLVALLRAVAAGRYAEALELPPPPAGPAAHAALATAHERRGDAAAALREWTAALAAGESEQARLARGSLLARAADWDGAAADLALAGGSPAARWNRASLAVHRALSRTPGLPDAASLAAASAEAGEPSAYWSDFTVGRLVWALASERAMARREVGELLDFDVNHLREAEDLFEHATFWDRAMMLVTYSRLELTGDAARIARPLAREQAAALLAEPAMKGAPLAPFAGAVATAYDAAASREPRAGWRALYLWMRDTRLRRYALPCAACGKGAVGIESFAGGDEAGGEDRESPEG